MAVALPLWFPWLARPVSSHFGVRFHDYRRLSYTRFAVTEAAFQQGDLRVKIGRLETWLPTVWLWLRYGNQSRQPGTTATVIAKDWELRILPGTTRRVASVPATNSTFAVIETVHALLPPLRTWLGTARLTNGLIVIGDLECKVAHANWSQGRLSVRLEVPSLKQTLSLDADLTDGAVHDLRAAVAPLDLELRARLARMPRAWSIAGQVAWEGNYLTMTNAFTPRDWWPATARWHCPEVRIPAHRLNLPGYGDVHGTVEINWKEQRFDLAVLAKTKPEASTNALLPPLGVDLRVQGSADSVLVHSLRARTPWLALDLSQPVHFDWRGHWTNQAARLNLAADLGDIPGSPLRGTVQGKVVLEPAEGGIPNANFVLASSQVTGLGFQLATQHLAGAVVWPAVTCRQGQSQFADGSVLDTRFAYDVEERRLSEGHWAFCGPLFTRFLPAGFQYASLQATGKFRGSLTNPVHSGSFTLRRLTGVSPAPLDAHGEWQGQGTDLTQAALRLTAGRSDVLIEGGVSLEPGVGGAIGLDRLALRQGDTLVYDLEKPCAVAVRRTTASDTSPSWSVLADNLRLVGDDRELVVAAKVQWPHEGRVELRARNVAPSHFADLVRQPAVDVHVQRLVASAQWKEGPVDLDATLAASVRAAADWPLEVEAALATENHGLRVKSLTVTRASHPLSAASGIVPLVIEPEGRALRASWKLEWPLDLQVRANAESALWPWLTAQSGLVLRQPDAQLSLEGFLDSPAGALKLHSRRLEFSRTNLALPPIENVRLQLEFAREAVRLQQLEVRVAGQAVEVTGQLPLAENAWSSLLNHGILPNWRLARARVQIVEGDISPLAAALPKVLAPDGRFQVDVEVQADGQAFGSITLEGLSTRPQPPWPPVRDLAGRIRLEGRSAVVEQFKGSVGGEEVAMAGHVVLPPGAPPQWDLHLTGTHVPLARQPGLILRGDLDAHLQQTSNASARVSGEVTLQDSLFFQDLNSLKPGGVTAPERRPPYFSVKSERLANWTLDLRVEGDRFMQIRSPLFRGRISSQLRLTGTLGEPLAAGEVRVNSGRIQFPFGGLDVKQGAVTLTSDNPHQPAMLVIASGLNYGYDVRLEVSGTAGEPLVSFSSTPALTSQQILLMLTGGEVPRRDVTISSTKRAQTLGLFLGKDLLNRFKSDKPVAERLTVRSGERVSDRGELTYYIEYKLDDRWSLVGEYDRFNAYNAGIKWKVYSK